MSGSGKAWKTIQDARCYILGILLVIVIGATAILLVELSPWNKAIGADKSGNATARRIVKESFCGEKGKMELCDGKKDCVNGTDETGCKSASNLECHGFRCGAEYQCISSNSVCDGRKDCLDGLDETNCDDNCKGVGKFRCSLSQSNGTCIEHSRVCDGSVDCLNGADEENCVEWSGWGPWCRYQSWGEVKFCAIFRHRQCRHARGEIVPRMRDCEAWGLNITRDVISSDVSRLCSEVTDLNPSGIELCAGVKNLTQTNVKIETLNISLASTDQSILEDPVRRLTDENDTNVTAYQMSTMADNSEDSRHVYAAVIGCFVFVLCGVLAFAAFCSARRRRTYNVGKCSPEIPQAFDAGRSGENGNEERASTSPVV